MGACGDNTASTAQVYDSAGNVSQITHHTDSGAVLVSQLTYAYNAANQRTLQTEYDGTQTAWTYDGKYQLVNELGEAASGIGWSNLTLANWAGLSVSGWAGLPVNPPYSGTYSITHTYDPAGNRTVMNANGTVTTFSYTPANRITLANTGGTLVTYTHDAAGNRTSMETSSGTSTYTTYYTWDATGQMTVAEPATGTVTFTYNSEGQRAIKDSGSVVTGYLYDYKKLLAETDDVGRIKRDASRKHSQ